MKILKSNFSLEYCVGFIFNSKKQFVNIDPSQLPVQLFEVY